MKSFTTLHELKEDPVMWIPLDKIFLFLPFDIIRCKIWKSLRSKNFLHLKHFILNGDWDLYSLPIEPLLKRYSVPYASMWQIFKDGVPYKKCDEYIQKKHEIETRGLSSRNLRNINELDLYFEALLKLKSDIENVGYKTSINLRKLKHDEIGVFIDRNGRFIKPADKFGGTHRFAVARIIGLSHIPVRIAGVHPEFASVLHKPLMDFKKFLHP